MQYPTPSHVLYVLEWISSQRRQSRKSANANFPRPQVYLWYVVPCQNSQDTHRIVSFSQKTRRTCTRRDKWTVNLRQCIFTTAAPLRCYDAIYFHFSFAPSESRLVVKDRDDSAENSWKNGARCVPNLTDKDFFFDEYTTFSYRCIILYYTEKISYSVNKKINIYYFFN